MAERNVIMSETSEPTTTQKLIWLWSIRLMRRVRWLKHLRFIVIRIIVGFRSLLLIVRRMVFRLRRLRRLLLVIRLLLLIFLRNYAAPKHGRNHDPVTWATSRYENLNEDLQALVIQDTLRKAITKICHKQAIQQAPVLW